MSVKVAIRVRPFNQRQKFLGCTSCVEMKNNTTVVYQNRGKQKKQHYFTFDYSFWSHDGFEEKQSGLLVPADQTYVDQTHVYQLLGEEILQNAWVGFNCCLFAYGQTGAGKSYSMIGYGANKGIIPMACEQLFERVKRFQKKGQREYEVTISMLQIYNQKVQDLLINTNKRPTNGLKIRQNKALGVYVQGLNKFPVNSYSQIQKKMQEGSKNRSLASTLMNQYSSRAHTIVMLEFIQKQWITDKKMNKKTSLINLVDLAGSQRVSKTGVGDNKDRLKEASLINKSLHTLGRVIEALAQQCVGKNKVVAIPYRQSALTRILQNALGGNSKTTMICAISPANDNCEQTLSTLRYADKTKKIKNKPVINQSQVDKLIRQLRQQNERLKQMLQGSQTDRNSPLKVMIAGQTQSQRKQMKSNLRASMRQIQKQIRKNLQSFAINTGDVIDQMDGEESLMMTEFIDLEDPSLSEFQTSFSSTTGKSQVFITNLNEDELLNFKVKYSCENNLLVANKNMKKNKDILEFDSTNKVILCGLGIEENHAKITKENGKMFIEALSETACQYTLLNGKPVYSKTQLMHNDRIILGTNSVFLFKNLANPSERTDKKYTCQKGIDYQFAINQRQQDPYEQSSISSNGSPLRRRPSNNSSQMQTFQDKQLVSRLEQIEEQFARMIEQNDRKTRQKQEKYKQKLLQLQRQKQLKERQKQNLQLELNQKKTETYKLRTKEIQIQKLQRKLAKFQEEKEKRKLFRESLLLDGIQGENQLENGAQLNVFQQIGAGDDAHENELNFKCKKSNDISKSDFNTDQFQEVLLEQYDEKSALGTTLTNTTNTNSMQIEESYFIGQVQNHQLQSKMKKNLNKPFADEQKSSESQQIQKYNKIVQTYLDKIKHRMGVFTKQYDITIYSQKMDRSKQAQMPQFNCQMNGGFHFCRHCKKVINKIQHHEYHENRYQTKTQNKYENRYQIQQLSDYVKQSTKNQNNPAKLKINLSKFNMSDFFHSDTDKSKFSDDEKSQRRSDSLGQNDESMLLNGIPFESNQKEQNNRKRVISQNFVNSQPLSEIAQMSLEQSRNLRQNNEINQSHPSLNTQSQFCQDFIKTLPIRQATLQRKEQQRQIKQQYKQIKEQQRQIKEQQRLDQESQNQFIQQLPVYELQTVDAQSKTCQSQIVSIKTSEILAKVKERKQQILFTEQTPKLKPITSEIQIQTEFGEAEDLRDSFEIKPKKPQARHSYLNVDFDFSVSDIQQGDHENSAEQSLNFSSLNTFKEQELTNHIQLLKQKIKQLQIQGSYPGKSNIQKIQTQVQSTNLVISQPDEQILSTAQKIRSKLKRYSQKDKIQQISEQDSQLSTPVKRSVRSKRLSQLPSHFSDKQFLKSRLNSALDKDLEKQLESNLVICNNQNIINERNLNIRKRKRQVQELKRSLFKKQKMELQKQLFVLIPMVERFNLIAKEISRLVEGKIEIQYRNFSHYQIIEALRNFTKSKWKKEANFSNVQIRIVIANLEEARIYKWPLQVFKNRFQIAEQIFQKYIQNSEDNGANSYNKKDIDKTKDPFWDPIDFIPNGVGYLALQCLLYDIDYQGEISFVHNSQIIAKAFVLVAPVKVKKRANLQQQANSIILTERPDNSFQIFNPRNFIESSLYFTLSIDNIIFTKPARQNSSAPLKFHISYELLVDDYKIQNYVTPQTDFKKFEQDHQVNYLRRHCFKQVSESTLAYISDCPIKFTLNLMKDYNEECLNTSFNQDLEKSVDETSLMDTSSNQLDITRELQQLQSSSFKTPEKTIANVELNKADFSKKEKKPLIYENTQLLQKMDKQCDEEDRRRKQKRQKLIDKESDLREKKQKIRKSEKDKDCKIY